MFGNNHKILFIVAIILFYFIEFNFEKNLHKYIINSERESSAKHINCNCNI